MAAGSEKDIGRLEGQVSQLLLDMQQVTRLLLGNGQQLGVLERIIRQESQLEHLVTLAGEYNGTGKAIKSDVQTIKECVQKHSDDKDLHSWRMFLNKKVVAFILGAFAFLHVLIDNGGPIWAKFVALFGF